MKINYKFNKDSEALTCKVESVELEILKEVKSSITEAAMLELLDIPKDNLTRLLCKYLKQLIKKSNFNTIKNLKPYWTYYLTQRETYQVCIKDNKFDLDTSTYPIEDESGTTDKNQIKNYLSDITISEFTLDLYSLNNSYIKTDKKLTLEFKGVGDFISKAVSYYDIIKIEDSTETETFTNQQDLTDYINSIKEEIKFIGSSSIDDVLLKDWLGEWEYEKKKVKKLKSITALEFTEELKTSYGYGSISYDCGDYCLNTYEKVYRNSTNIVMKEEYSCKDILLQRQFFEEYEKEELTNIKTGSPKLNTNWKFKIK